jgi:mannose-6-phosphate isomerase-like protein (cupin superfamily)
MAQLGPNKQAQAGRYETMRAKVNFHEQLGRLVDYWSAKIVTSVNDYDVKLIKVRGQFVWHQHASSAGQLHIHLQDHGDVVLRAGELFVVPRGVCHCPVADEATHVVLLGPRETAGDAKLAGTVGERLD